MLQAFFTSSSINREVIRVNKSTASPLTALIGAEPVNPDPISFEIVLSRINSCYHTRTCHGTQAPCTFFYIQTYYVRPRCIPSLYWHRADHSIRSRTTGCSSYKVSASIIFRNYYGTATEQAFRRHSPLRTSLNTLLTLNRHASAIQHYHEFPNCQDNINSIKPSFQFYHR